MKPVILDQRENREIKEQREHQETMEMLVNLAHPV